MLEKYGHQSYDGPEFRNRKVRKFRYFCISELMSRPYHVKLVIYQGGSITTLVDVLNSWTPNVTNVKYFL